MAEESIVTGIGEDGMCIALIERNHPKVFALIDTSLDRKRMFHGFRGEIQKASLVGIKIDTNRKVGE